MFGKKAFVVSQGLPKMFASLLKNRVGCVSFFLAKPSREVLQVRNIMGIPEIVLRVIRLTAVPFAARLVLLEFISQATTINREGKLVAPVSMKRVSEVLGINRRSLNTYVNELERQGIVSRHYYGTNSVVVIIDIEKVRGGIGIPGDRNVIEDVSSSREEKEETFIENVVVVTESQENEEVDEVEEDEAVECLKESQAQTVYMKKALEAISNRLASEGWRERMVKELVEEFGDYRSRRFYELLVRKVSYSIIEEARRITRGACYYREVRNPGAYFVGVLKNLLNVRRLDFGFGAS